MEYASFLINRGEVGHDGKTPYERCKAKRGKLPGLASGEKILWKRRPVEGDLSKLTCLWEDGIFLGMKGSSGEYIVGDGKGVWKKKTLDDGVEIVRSRLVGRDFKMKGKKPEQFFAAIPPWEAKKLLFKMSMVNPKKRKLETKLMCHRCTKGALHPSLQ